MGNVEDVIEEVQDLNMPRRVWAIIDRVGKAAEEVYLDEQHRARVLERQREAAEHAWTHCPYCGRAYAEAEGSVVTCPSCGGPRGPKPSWLT
jgi:predicted Zn-ribbon and HTH transcriptional regulator